MSEKITKIESTEYAIELSGERKVWLKKDILYSWQLISQDISLLHLIALIKIIFDNEDLKINQLVLRNYSGASINLVVEKTENNNLEDYYEVFLADFSTAYKGD